MTHVDAQIRRADRADRAECAGQSAITPSLVADIEAFKTAMIETDSQLQHTGLVTHEAQTRVAAACDLLEQTLRVHLETAPASAQAIGAHVLREAFPYLMQSRSIDRVYSKPRGYAGDYATIEMIYNDIAAGDGRLGPYIDRWALSMPAARAVKNRRVFLSDAIRQIAASWMATDPVRITSLASGPARELFDLWTTTDPPPIHATCVDIDPEALAYTAELARQVGVSDRFSLVQDNLIRLARGRGNTDVAPQHMIYSVGLIDYLEDNLVVDLFNWCYQNLVPGGTIVVGNFAPSNPNRAYMEHILEWVLIHRSADDLRQLFGRSQFASAPIEVRAEAAGVNLFAFCRKPSREQ